MTFNFTKLHKVVRLNNNLVDRTVVDKTKRNIGLLIGVLKVMSYNL